jgi:hypothetical protein
MKERTTKERQEWLTKTEMMLNKMFKLKRCPWPSFGLQPGFSVDGNSGGEQHVILAADERPALIRFHF